MIVYLARDIRPFVMYCINGKPRSSLLIESTDSMIYFSVSVCNVQLPFGRSSCYFAVQSLCSDQSAVADSGGGPWVPSPPPFLASYV